MGKAKRQRERQQRKAAKQMPKDSVGQAVAALRKQEDASSPVPTGRFGWQNDNLWHFPLYDVPRLVAKLEDFPELVRLKALRDKEATRRIAQIRKELLTP